MAQTVHVPGAQLACSTHGEGSPVLLVHGIAERAESWGPVVAQASASARVIAYDRRGYGDSSAPEPYERTTVAEQAEDAAALLDAVAGGPAIVCGRDFGALVALDLAKRHRRLVVGVAVIDPPLFAFSAAATEVLSAERLALEDSLRDGGPAAAVRDWLQARGAEPRRLEWADADHTAFFADFAGLATWPVSRRELRALDVPLAVLLSATAPSHVREAAEALATLVPEARLESDVTQALVALDRDIRG
ncbi:MAG: alpha/beta hydrolase [Actinomycetota bacterium]|nr:alpha/beta hydrolase [Actinomycetota bacterium]